MRKQETRPDSALSLQGIEQAAAPAPKWPQASGTPAHWEAGAMALRGAGQPQHPSRPRQLFTSRGLGW